MDEPTAIYRWVLFHFGSGEALLPGLLGISCAIAMDERGWRSSLVALSLMLGGFWLLLSSWPSLWIQGVLLGSVLAWFIIRVARMSLHRLYWSRRLVYLLCLVAILGEKRFSFVPELPAMQELAVIGDSVTAGLNDRDITWPRVIAEQHGITVHDASQQGATCRSAQQQVRLLAGRGDAVLLEIGGNDVLEYIAVEKYAADLEHLLRDVRAQYPTQPVVMCELPLPPLGHRYGYAQRQLAARYRIALIPKRNFLRVLTMPHATVDGIHLSDQGQELMASLMAQVLRKSVTPATADYHRYEPTANLR